MSFYNPRPGEHPDSVVRKFKKRVEADGVLDEIKKRQHYQTRRERDRIKHKKAVARQKREQANNGR